MIILVKKKKKSTALVLLYFQQTRNLSSDDSIPESKKNQRPHPETPQFPDEYSTEPLKGKIYDKKPFRLELMANKNYFWCVCGTSKSQVITICFNFLSRA